MSPQLLLLFCALFGVPAAVGSCAAAALVAYMVNMPGRSYSEKLPALTLEQREISQNCSRHIHTLADEIGERNYVKMDNLSHASDYIVAQLKAFGAIDRQFFEYDAQYFENIELEFPGNKHKDEIIVIGAHYDSVLGCPGANDNASGVAVLIEIARLLKEKKYERTIRFVAFTNEEYFAHTGGMGSIHYANRCGARKEKIVAMISLETIGYFSNEPGSQDYPKPFDVLYPNQGNFIAFVGNLQSHALVTSLIKSFRKTTPFPSQGLAAPDLVPGIGNSDHAPFWKYGYQAIMVTDTAPYRYPHYHQATDTPDKVDCDKMALVISGLTLTFEKLARVQNV